MLEACDEESKFGLETSPAVVVDSTPSRLSEGFFT
jgi:hypothetical protein